MDIKWRFPEKIISCNSLNQKLGDANLRIFDCSTFLDYTDDHPSKPYDVKSCLPNYEKVHIPTAAYLDLQKDLSDIGVSNDLRDQIISLVDLGKKGGIDGIVCSPNDLAYLNKEEMDAFITVCPGIRVKGESGGQKRTASIHDAINMGADYLVVAREIISSSDPLKVINEIDSYFI